MSEGGSATSVRVRGHIAPAHQGHGHASESARAIFEFVFDQFGCHRVHASVDPRNLASVAMLQLLGMGQETDDLCFRKRFFTCDLLSSGDWTLKLRVARIGETWHAPCCQAASAPDTEPILVYREMRRLASRAFHRSSLQVLLIYRRILPLKVSHHLRLLLVELLDVLDRLPGLGRRCIQVDQGRGGQHA